MISSLFIDGFKRFRKQLFPLRKLSILAGLNGTGKTSVIQSILLAREAACSQHATISLNGPFGLELGTFEDVLNRESTDTFNIQVAHGDSVQDFRFHEPENQLQEFYVHVTLGGDVSPTFIREGRAFQYLGAERAGPRLLSKVSAVPHHMLNIGPQGENSAQLLDSMSAYSIPKERLSDSGADTSLLKDEVEAWLSRLTRPIQVDTESFPGIPMVAIKYRTEESWLRPTNMGFGVTYALPIVLAGLTAERDGLFLIENPEAHLHPAGQSQVGYFLAQVAASGVQVIVETHSDHVLNGIRRAIGESQLLVPEDAIIHFFDETNAPVALEFTVGGGISHWPPGFFDQFQIDVAALTRIRRHK